MNRTRRLTKIGNRVPLLADPQTTFIAPNAQVMGGVSLGKNTSVWYGSILRADMNSIIVGDYANIQDRCYVFGLENPNNSFPVEIGQYVTIESGVTLQGCLIEDNSFVGIGATILDGVEIGKGSMIAPGSLVTPGTMIGDGEFWAGNPARKVRDLTKQEIEQIKDHAYLYYDLAMKHKEETEKSPEEILMELEETTQRLIALNNFLPGTYQREYGDLNHTEDEDKRRVFNESKQDKQ